MSMRVISTNNYKANCLNCGSEVKPKSGVYGQPWLEYNQKIGRSNLKRVDRQIGVYCKQCVDIIKGE